MARHPENSSKQQSLHFETLAAIAKQPIIPALFILLALFQAAALTVVFLSHSEPFLSILGPIIRRFWGERFLHYPENFLLLPKLFGHAEMVVLTLAGLLATGIVIQLLAGGRAGNSRVTAVSAFTVTLKKYFGMAFLWLGLFFVLRTASRSILPHLPALLPAHFAGLVAVFLMTQTLTAFLFPSILLSGKNYWKSLGEGILLSLKNFPQLLVVLFIPVVVSVAVSFLRSLSPSLSHDNPDFVLVILYVSILVSTAVDLYITSATAIFYLKVRN